MMGAIGKAFLGAGDNVLSAMRGWWDDGLKAAAQEAEQNAGKTAQEILNALDKNILEGVSTATKQRLQQGFATARSNVNQRITTLLNELKNLPGGGLHAGVGKPEIKVALNNTTALLQDVNKRAGMLEKVLKQIDWSKSPNFTDEEIKRFDLFDRQLKNAKDEIRGLLSRRDILSDLYHTRDFQDLLRAEDYNAVSQKLYNVGEEYAERALGTGLRPLLESAVNAQRSASPNLTNTTAFLKDYLNMHLKGDKAAIEAFEANPFNAQKLFDIRKRQPGLIKQLIEQESTRIPLKKQLAGLTWRDTAKNVGIATGLTAAGAGIVKLYNWFGNNDPAATVMNSQGLGSGLANLQVQGEAEDLLNSANNSLNNISQLAAEVNSGLVKDPQVAVPKYVSGVAKEINNLNNVLNNWNQVVESSNNPAAAKIVEKNLRTFVQNTNNSLNKLAVDFGVSLNVDKQPGKSIESNSDILKIQNLLGIDKTGKLDENTIKTLKKLENDFNARAATTAFTDLFVKSDGQIISYSDLIKAFNLINKY